jgi:hypothetical protein
VSTPKPPNSISILGYVKVGVNLGGGVSVFNIKKINAKRYLTLNFHLYRSEKFLVNFKFGVTVIVYGVI